ncbi:hypothetical protein BHE74_00046485 [Ensete ventricosum]|nr:hypothetical protein BHE74_00046485 [Ensete ventricosum]RZS20371.1 hypothetical protein BHM03_00052871 [Ensete ventricosum]
MARPPTRVTAYGQATCMGDPHGLVAYGHCPVGRPLQGRRLPAGAAPTRRGVCPMATAPSPYARAMAATARTRQKEN